MPRSDRYMQPSGTDRHRPLAIASRRRTTTALRAGRVVELSVPGLRRPVRASPPSGDHPSGWKALAAWRSHWFGGEALLSFLATLLLARASLLDEVATFHLAFLAVVAVSLPSLYLYLPVALAAVGMRWLAAGIGAGFVDLLAVGAIPLLKHLLLPAGPAGTPTGTDDRNEVRVSVTAGGLAGGAVLLAHGLAILIRGGSTLDWITLGFAAVITALVAVLFWYAWATIQQLRIAGDLPDHGMTEAFADDAGRSADAGRTAAGVGRDRWIAVAVWMAALIAGLNGLMLGPVRLDLAFCGFFVLTAARLAGPGAGAAVGATIAGTAVINGALDPVSIGSQAAAGLLAGVLAEYGTVGAVAGYVIAELLLSAFYHSPEEVASSLWSVLPAAAGFMIWDGSTLSGLLERWTRDRGRQRGCATYEFGPVHRGAPRSWRSGSAAGTPARPPTTAERGVEIVRRYAEMARELAQTFDQAAPNEQRFRQRTASELINQIALQVCPGCTHHVTCWDREFLKTYQGLARVLAQRENQGAVTTTNLPTELQSRCPRQQQLVAGINNAYEVFEANYRWWRRYDGTRRTVALQLRAVADVLDRVSASGAAATGGGEGAGPGAVTTLPYRVGVAKVPKDKKLVSGDSCLHRQIGDDRLVLVLSDGMGAGTRAAAESRTTVNLLEKMLELGLDETAAVRSVNQLLLLRASDEVFTTLDLALVDLREGSSRFLKIGAAPSFIRRGNRVSVIRAGTLPMGILSEPDVQVTRKVLQRGDVVVMLTDGVIQAWDHPAAGEDWIRGFLANLERLEPRHIAGEILREAVRRSRDGVRDDMTVMVLKML